MTGIIQPSTLEEIRAANDIVTIIGSYFNLQQRGSTFKALCPFHKEKTPSFIINQQRQTFHCFGCGAGGNVFQFIMDYEKVDFITSVKMLAQRAGIKLSFEGRNRDDGSNKEILYELLEETATFYHKTLLKTEMGENAREYLKRRGLTLQDIKEFKLGFAPDQWDAILNWAKKKYNIQQLKDVGLIVESVKEQKAGSEKKHYYDRFRNRVIFPINDEQGRVVGFSARALNPKDESAKYVNTPDTTLFHKGKLLYGMHKARRDIVQTREALICEGQLDVIKCHQAGFVTAVAPQGTAFTEEHARILKRYTDSVLLVFDADQAGRTAALRASDILVQNGIATRVAKLPTDEDPDSMLKKKDGAAAFRKLLDNAVSALDFLIDLLSESEKLDTEAGLMRVSSAVIAMIEKTPNSFQQEMLIKKAGERLGISDASLRKELKKNQTNRRSPAKQEESPDKQAHKIPSKEEALAEHLVVDLSLAYLVKKYLPLKMITDPLCRTIIEASLEAADKDEETLNPVFSGNAEHEEISRFIARVFATPIKAKGELATGEDSVKSLILGIRADTLKRRRKKLEKAQAQAKIDKKTSELRKLEMEYYQCGYDIAGLKKWETAVPIMENEA